MKSSKWIFGLMAIMLVLVMAPSGFAQTQVSIFNAPSPQEISTARNAQTADPASIGSGILVSGANIASAPLTSTKLILTFPATISSSPDAVDNSLPGGAPTPTPRLDPIKIVGATGIFATATIATVKYAEGIIQISLPGDGVTPVSGSGTFRVTGVRLDVNGKTAPLTVTASLSSSANNYLLGGNTATLINSLGAGIASFTQAAVSGTTNNGTALMFANQVGGTFADNKASILLAEGFASAWRSNTQVSTNGGPVGAGSGGNGNGTMIRLTIAGLPTGVNATLSQVVTSTSPNISITYIGGAGVLDSSSSGVSNVAFVQFTSGPPMTVTETLGFDVVLGGAPTGTVTPGNITLTATLATVGNALSGSGNPTQTAPDNNPAGTGYVRFAAADLGPVTVGTIISANTAMLIPYAVKVGAYDTGIAIANTTADPFGGPLSGSASPAAGNLVFTLFPRTDTGAGTSFPLTTSATARPGVGLSTDGTLAAGGTWTGLVTDLLTAAGKTGDFFGYIFIQANFLDAHGAAYIFNGAGFTSGTPVLVLPPPAQFSRNSPAGGVESLNN
jgi:hypothetical protein